MIRKPVFSTILVACGLLAFGQPAVADVPTMVLPCSACSATADYVNAAIGAAKAAVFPGTYMVISYSRPGTAFISVHGTRTPVRPPGSPVIPPNPTYVLTNITAVPVDASGNSLASQSESDQESFYTSLDGYVFGASRSKPVAQVAVPYEYASTFIDSTEEEVSPGIGAGLIAAGINPAIFEPGSFITATFTDGTTAVYVKASLYNTYQWTWTGTAHNAQGKLMLRDGTLVTNPGHGSGGGGATPNNLSGGAGPSYGVTGWNLCLSVTTVTVNGVVVAREEHYTWCGG